MLIPIFNIFHTVLVVRIQVYKTNSDAIYKWFITTLEASINDDSNIVINSLYIVFELVLYT
jgi:hypothetical protein